MSDGQVDNSRSQGVPIQLRSVSVIGTVVKSFDNLWRATLCRLRSLSPQVVALLVCLFAIPVLILFSTVAGWLVWKNVPKGWSIPVYLQYGDGGPPYADITINNLFTDQPYDMSLHLIVPATEANYVLGNFMTSFTITDYSNNTIASVRKPALVLPPNPSRIPFVFRTPQLLELTLPLVAKLITGRRNIFARVELGRKDGWRSLGTGEGRELSVHTAFLHGDAHPQGLRRILSAFPLSVAIAAAVAFFIVSALILISFLIPSIQWRIEPASEDDEKPQPPPQGEASSLKTESDDDHDFYTTKEEPHEQGIPTAGPSTGSETELRLRTRKRSG